MRKSYHVVLISFRKHSVEICRLTAQPDSREKPPWATPQNIKTLPRCRWKSNEERKMCQNSHGTAAPEHGWPQTSPPEGGGDASVPPAGSLHLWLMSLVKILEPLQTAAKDTDSEVCCQKDSRSDIEWERMRGSISKSQKYCQELLPDTCSTGICKKKLQISPYIEPNYILSYRCTTFNIFTNKLDFIMFYLLVILKSYRNYILIW